MNELWGIPSALPVTVRKSGSGGWNIIDGQGVICGWESGRNEARNHARRIEAALKARATQ